jgi:hypothetical protein
MKSTALLTSTASGFALLFGTIACANSSAELDRGANATEVPIEKMLPTFRGIP